MEQYRHTIKTRRNLLAAAVLLVALILTAQNLGWFPMGKESFYDGFLYGFIGGGLTSMDLVFIFLLAKCSKALRNEEILNDLYIKENDERQKYIRSKTGGLTMYICSIVILLAAVIAGNYSQTVFFSLLACSVFLFLVIGLLKIYYMKKF